MHYFLKNYEKDWNAMTNDWIILAEKTFNDKLSITDDTFPDDVEPLSSYTILNQIKYSKSIFKKYAKKTWVDYQSQSLTTGEMDILTASVGMDKITKSKKFSYYLYKLNQKYNFNGWNEKRDKHFDNIFNAFSTKYDNQIRNGLHKLFKRQLSVGKKSIFYAANAGKTFWFIPSEKLYKRDLPPEAFISNYETKAGGSGYEFLLDVGVQTPETGIPIGTVKVIFRFAQGQMNGLPTTKSDYKLMTTDWSDLLGAFRK